MEEEVLNIVQNVFGSVSRKHNRTRYQIAYDCPLCDNGLGKGKLEINYSNLVMKCWSCGGDSDGLKGPLRKLIKNYGTTRELKLYDETTEGHEFQWQRSFDEDYVPDVHLPKEYIKLENAEVNPQYLKAYEYITQRGVSDEDIKKYDMGYCKEGDFSGRIIIPSYDKNGRLNFFVARSYVGHKRKYDLPVVSKMEIIVNELNINWDSTIYLVEGMFDMLGLGMDNTIPLLGKVMPDKLFYTLLRKCKGYVVVCLDPDARRNAYGIYTKLDNTFQLNGRVRVIDLPLKKDIAEIKEEFGVKGVLKCIRMMRKLELEDKLEFSLV